MGENATATGLMSKGPTHCSVQGRRAGTQKVLQATPLPEPALWYNEMAAIIIIIINTTSFFLFFRT